MPTIIDGTNGIDKIAAGAIEYADLPAGSVLQVVTANAIGASSTTATSYVDTGLSCSITPKFSTSKIMVMVNHNSPAKNNGNSSDFAMQLLRGATQIYVPTSDSLNTNSTAQNYGTTMSFNYIDSPATTSSTTYKTQFYQNSSSGTVYCHQNGATMILMEIAA